MSLVLDGVVKSYPGFELGPIDLEIDREVLGVLGPSGCGKTTLLSTVAGIVEPDAGRVVLDGVDLTDRPPERRATGVVFQNGALFPHMSARENIAYAASTPERVEALAETLEIGDVLDREADTLSGGERQRVALARSLAADPRVLLCDEPLANLDAPVKRRLRDELRVVLSSLGIPVVYVTHDQREASALCDRLAVVADGAVLQVDTPETVFAKPTTPFVASFTGSVNLFRARVAETSTHTVLDWNGRRLVANESGFAVGDEVHFCIRPAHVTVADSGGENVVTGSVARRTFEGDDYLLSVALDGGDGVRCTLSPPAYDALAPADGDPIELSLEPDAIHVIGDTPTASDPKQELSDFLH